MNISFVLLLILISGLDFKSPSAKYLHIGNDGAKETEPKGNLDI